MRTIIIGYARCGISLVNSIISCSGNALTDAIGFYFDSQPVTNHGHFYLSISCEKSLEHGLRLLSIFKTHGYAFDKFVWLIRNPISSTSSNMVVFNGTAEQALSQWYVTNTVLWYYFSTIKEDNKFIMRFEDVFLSKSKIRNLFSFMDIEFDEQYLKCEDYNDVKPIDYEKVDSYCRDQLHEIEDIWPVYSETPLIKEMGYSAANSE